MRIDDASASASGSGVPARYADPRSLSQAWYDALYPNRARASRSMPAARTRAVVSPATIPNATQRQVQLRSPEAGDAARGGRAYENRGEMHAATDPITGSRTLQRMPRRLLLSRVAEPYGRDTSSLRVELEQPDGPPLRLLLQAIASGIHVVAVCSHPQRARIENSLQRTRAGLAARGISFDYEVHDA